MVTLGAVIATSKVTHMLIDGAGHGETQFSTDANLRLMIVFLDQHLE